MKKQNMLSRVFGVLGVVLAVTALMICLTQREAEPKRVGGTPGAERCARGMMERLSSGDLVGTSDYLYGSTDLGLEESGMEPAARLIWDAFVSSLNAVPQGECYATVSGLAQDFILSGLDIPSLTRELKKYAPAILDARIEGAEDMSQVYDGNHEYREDFTQSVLEEAARKAIAAVTPRERPVTVRLTYQDGRWWAVPDQALLTAISGGIISF